MRDERVELAFPFLGRQFLVGDQKNNGLALIFLIDERGRELQLGGGAVVSKRSFGGAGGQITGCAGRVDGGKRGQDRHRTDCWERTIILHGRERIGLESGVQEPEISKESRNAESSSNRFLLS